MVAMFAALIMLFRLLDLSTGPLHAIANCQFSIANSRLLHLDWKLEIDHLRFAIAGATSPGVVTRSELRVFLP